MGFMACGKSTIGAKLSNNLNKKLIDTDDLIEQKEGLKISEIFANKGEAYFRELEVASLKSLLKEEDACIISLGGGTPLRKENQGILKELGTIVYLKASPETIFNRTKHNNKRPLLQCENPRERIERLLTERNPIYQSLADVVIDVDGKEIYEVVNDIMEEIFGENISH